MKKLAKVLTGAAAGVLFLGAAVSLMGKRKEKGRAEKAEAHPGLQGDGRAEGHQPYGPYEAYFKRPLDCMAALLALLFLWPVLGAVALLVKIKLGSPVIFTQERPGRADPKTGRERIFKLYKFRTMADARDENGELLPDGERLTGFGKKLRATSLDELPELLNILKGEMSLVGPRPQLVRDLVFMSASQRRRHAVKPGLSGLAQVNGRNAISWEERLGWDLKYIEKISFLGDLEIIFLTVIKAFVRQEGITDGDMATSLDYGDWLLKAGKVSREEYEEKQGEAERILEAAR